MVKGIPVPAALHRSNRKLVRTLGLMASASLMSLMMSGEAQAACTVSSGNPLNNVTTNNSSIDCVGANTGQTIVVNANEIQMQVNSPGDTLDNSSVSFTGTNNLLVIQNSATSANLSFAGNGSGNSIRIVSSATNVSANLFGSGSNFELFSGGSATAAPGNIVLAGNTDDFNAAVILGTLAATGNNGGNYLLTGGIGDQAFNIQGTLTVQPNGLAISAGGGNDTITLGSSAVVNGGTGNNITFDGGSGTDVLSIAGGGTSTFVTTNIEQLQLNPGGANTRILQGSGDYSSVFVGPGTVRVGDLAALGQANSTVSISFTGRLQLDPTTPVTFSHALSGSGQLQQIGQTITYNAPAGSYSGIFTVAGGTAVITANNVFGTGTIVDNAAIQFNNIGIYNNISGSGTVTKTGNGVGALGGNNTYSGGTFVNGGVLQLAGGGAVGSGAVTIAANAILSLNFATDQTLANNITGAGMLYNSAPGTATLTGTNTYSGGTFIVQGAIRVDDFARLGTGPVQASGGANLILN